MKELQTFFSISINYTELFSAFIAILFYRKINKTYWKWFVIYLIFINLAELYSKFGLENFTHLRKYYYDFFIIPIEFLFFYWLYAKKSLKLEKLFWLSYIIYFIFYILHLFNFDKVRLISSMSYTVGVLFLAIMVYLEFIKQIKSDEIINFHKNKMFYINIGILLFYVGTLPFFAFDKQLYLNNNELWSNYKTFFLLSVNIMYLLFAASFIWGKPKP